MIKLALETETLLLLGADLLMAACMFLIGLWFYRSGGKAASFLSGYSFLPEEKRKKIDEKAMCKSYGKYLMAMALPFVGGAIIDLFYTGAGCALGFFVWVILFVCLMIHRNRLENPRSSDDHG